MSDAVQILPAHIIAQQMGGIRRLDLMVGAHQFFHADGGNTLQFAFKGCKTANKIRVTLTPADTYDVTFYKINARKLSVQVVKELEGVYEDQLVEIFESTTGLYLSL